MGKVTGFISSQKCQAMSEFQLYEWLKKSRFNGTLRLKSCLDLKQFDFNFCIVGDN